MALPTGLGQQRFAGSGKGQAGTLMAEILKQQGHARSDMRKILDQLPHFAGYALCSIFLPQSVPLTLHFTNVPAKRFQLRLHAG